MFATRRSRPTILSKRTSLPPCTTVYNRCTPRPVSGHQHAALSHRGRQRGRLPRARGRQDRQEGAQPQALGGRRGAALQYIQPSAVHVYSRLVLFIPYHSLLNYIRLPLYLTPSTYLRIVVPVPGQVQTWCYCIQQCRS